MAEKTTRLENAPVLVDLGRVSRRKIKQLRRGEGELINEINDCFVQLKSQGKINQNAEPVIVILEKKSSKSMMLFD